MASSTTQDLAQQIEFRRTKSYQWMKDNFYTEWENVFKSYKCLRDPELDEDGNPDDELISVGMPLTWSHIRRLVARGTAQIPNLKFRSKDPQISELIGRTLMYQWDRAGIQRLQKRHFAQAALFGVSVRPWYFAVDEYERNKRVDPLDPNIDPATLQQISQAYGVPVESLADPQAGALVRAELLAKSGRGGLLPVRYPYRAYVGPKCDFLFLGDCYFQPNFQTLQSSGWFIVERRRNIEWIKAIVKRYPQFSEGFDALLQAFPRGTPRYTNRPDTQGLRERMMGAIGWSDTTITSDWEDTKEWTILEQHTPGSDPKLAYVGESTVWIGEIPYPYDLDGKIAFTDLVLIDDMLTGIGDSVARVLQGIQQLHDRSVNARLGLIYNLLRPLVGTSNRELYENPDSIKRINGLRLVLMRGPGDMWVQGEQAAMASAAAGLQDESGVMRLYQLLTGDSNMSMAANVDPNQARTATGARLMAYNQDVLTKDLTDMWNETSIKPDAEMMFLLNRSELADAVEFDSSKYNRTYTAEQDLLKEQWTQAEPIHFQMDGEITAEVGSTLADDDEARVTKAQNLFQAATARPDLFNQQKARDEFLIAMGKGRELQQWAAPPQPPPPPPELRPSLTVAAKWELLSDEERQQIMQRAGISVNVSPPPGAAGAMPPDAAGPAPPGAMPPAGPPQGDQPMTAMALNAAVGGSPFNDAPQMQ